MDNKTANLINEQLLLEKTRAELLDKSKSADIVKSYGTTRLERKDHIRLFDTTDAFNKVDMNAFFQANILWFVMPVHGETDDYQVEILFENILDDIREEIKSNNYELEFKCIYRALVRAVNNNDIYVGCTCPDQKYRHNYWSTKGKYNGMVSELRPSNITNPNDTKGAGCKHIMKLIADLDWVLSLSTCINNYIMYIWDHYEDKFRRLIYPVLWDIPFEQAEKMGIFNTTDEFASPMDKEETEQEIAQANAEASDDYEEPEEIADVELDDSDLEDENVWEFDEYGNPIEDEDNL